jgi:hypothetical protein
MSDTPAYQTTMPWPSPDEGRGHHWARLGVQWLLVVGVNGRWQDTLGYHLPDRILAHAEYHGPVLTPADVARREDAARRMPAFGHYDMSKAEGDGA